MMSIEEKLSKNKYNVDESNAHIEMVENTKDLSMEEKMKLVNGCPARLYRLQEDGSLQFDYAGCLECGTCRILSKGKVVEKWTYPQDGMGVEFREG